MEKTIHCDRCLKTKPGYVVDGPFGMSAGCYMVGKGSHWHEMARPGEEVVCDDCMWEDPKYIARYGDRRPHAHS